MSQDSYINSHRLNESRRAQILNKLDGSSPASSAAHGVDRQTKGRDKRHDKRFEFRVTDIAMSVEHPGGGTSRILVCPRNLSAGGMGFLHGGFLHPKSRCALRLHTLDGKDVVVIGVIASCTLVDGLIHLVGVRFDRRIDPQQFVSPMQSNGESTDGMTADSIDLPNLCGRVLYIEDSAPDRKLVAHFLKATGIQLVEADKPEPALEAVKQNKVDIILADLNLEGSDGVEFIKSCRGAGFTGPIVAVSAESDGERIKKAKEAGAGHRLQKPYDAKALLTLMQQLHKDIGAVFGENAIRSEFRDQPGMTDLINEYVEQMHQVAQRLEQSLSAQQAEPLRLLCLNVKGSASNYGFKALGDLASEALRRLDGSGSIPDAAAQIRSLAVMCAQVTGR